MDEERKNENVEKIENRVSAFMAEGELFRFLFFFLYSSADSSHSSESFLKC